MEIWIDFQYGKNCNLITCIEKNKFNLLFFIYLHLQPASFSISLNRRQIRSGPLTLHTESAIHIAEALTKAKFSIR